MSEAEAQTRSEPRLKPQWLRLWWVAVMQVLLVAIYVYLAWQSQKVNNRLSDQIDCQAEFNKESVASSKLRNEWADQDRQALSDLVSAITSAKTHEDTQKALLEYQRITQRNQDKRKDNPPPTNNCSKNELK